MAYKPKHLVCQRSRPSTTFYLADALILAILVAKRAFRDYETIEELLDLVPPDGEMYPLQWRESVVDLPFFESMSAKAPSGKIENRCCLLPVRLGRVPASLSCSRRCPRQCSLPVARLRRRRLFQDQDPVGRWRHRL